MLKSNDQALDIFQEVRALVETWKEGKVKVLKTDRGGEFTSSQLFDESSKAGILRHFMASYTT